MLVTVSVKSEFLRFTTIFAVSISLTRTSLAYAEMRLILAKLVWNFDLELDPRSKNWLEKNVLRFMWDKPELYVRLIPRTKA